MEKLQVHLTSIKRQFLRAQNPTLTQNMQLLLGALAVPLQLIVPIGYHSRRAEALLSETILDPASP
jgi:hypothetical protein